MVESADDYPWSSHRAHLGLEELPWLTTEFGLGLFGATIEAARLRYRETIEATTMVEATVPGLLPSDDPRVIGTDRFLASLPAPRVKPRSRLSLGELANQICTERLVSLEELTSSSKLRSICEARAALPRRAVDERIASLNEVARLFGRTSAAMSQLLARRRR